MREAWVCPKCHVGVAPHCDVCPNCTKPLDLRGMPLDPMPIEPLEGQTIGAGKIIPGNPNDPENWVYCGLDCASITTGGTSAIVVSSNPVSNLQIDWRITQ